MRKTMALGAAFLAMLPSAAMAELVLGAWSLKDPTVPNDQILRNSGPAHTYVVTVCNQGSGGAELFLLESGGGKFTSLIPLVAGQCTTQAVAFQQGDRMAVRPLNNTSTPSSGTYSIVVN